MGREIERKFLVRGDEWRRLAERTLRMSQGYLASTARASIRVRVAGERAWLNIKSGGFVAARQEYEYAILAVGPLIEKTRHYVRHDGLEWEVDEFHGRNEGLVVAELELEREDQPFARPAWVGLEVTHLERYYNVRLVDRPYDEWDDAERSP